MSVLDLFKLQDRIAVVTGAGRGLGKAMAMGLAEAGAHVAVAELVKETGEQTVEAISAMGRRSIFVPTDVSDYSSVKQMADTVSKELGRIDILVNNAGVVYTPQEPGGSASIPTEEVDPENWDRVVKIDLNAVFYCSHAVGKYMIAQKKGAIVNIASMSDQ